MSDTGPKAPNQTQELQIQMPPEVQKGSYANNMVVAHTQEEFVMDFILATPPVGTVSARVIVSPSHAKRIAQALIENIAKYEERFGKVQDIPSGLPGDVTAH
ncbi:MAG: DUF3467 domain-containing protein [Mariprofundaceae bacterium]